MNEDYFLETNYQIADRELEEAHDELIDCEIEELKISEAEKIRLLELLLEEVNNQIENKTPNLIKIREILQR